MQLFEKSADYQAFEVVVRETLDGSPMRICAYVVMPNHRHLVLWPERDGELAAFMERLTNRERGNGKSTEAMRDWVMSTKGATNLSQWRATSITVLVRYVERNALRAGLVLRAEEWRWSSLWRRCHGTTDERLLLSPWPIDVPTNWLERVNQSDDQQELDALRRSVQRGRPFGPPDYMI
jgi:putative transposase